MGVNLRVGPIAYPIGTAAFLGSFFDTITARLESGVRGSRFPMLARLYGAGELGSEDAPAAASELAIARTEFNDLPTSAVVWDLDDPSARPPWGDDIAPTITNLSDYFVTSDGRPLIAVMEGALDAAVRTSLPATIR